MNKPSLFKQYLEAVRSSLIQDWDPIGVGAIKEAQDEYDSYAPKLAEMLLEGKSRQEIFDYLWWLENEHMGLTGDRSATERFAGKLIGIARELLG